LICPKNIDKLPSVLEPVTKEQGANAAVAIILKPRNDEFDFLLVKRATRANDVWSGQMAFPGGKRECNDQTLSDTVVRETYEETGIDLRDERILGVLDTVQSTPRRDFLILPFVFLLSRDPEIRLNTCELESSLWVSYEKIRKSKGTFVRPEFGEVPAFILGNSVVWGITYKIITRFFERLGLL
jgi:8-oxo-dGTP pyrophosphatase MutT (NUDIX family)